MPALELKPGDSGYNEVYDEWVLQGQPHLIERMNKGWLYRATWPVAGASQPTFTLVASQPLTSADADGPPKGYAGAMGTRQSTLPGGRRDLPKQ